MFFWCCCLSSISLFVFLSVVLLAFGLCDRHMHKQEVTCATTSLTQRGFHSWITSMYFITEALLLSIVTKSFAIKQDVDGNTSNNESCFCFIADENWQLIKLSNKTSLDSWVENDPFCVSSFSVFVSLQSCNWTSRSGRIELGFVRRTQAVWLCRHYNPALWPRWHHMTGFPASFVNREGQDYSVDFQTSKE